MLYNEDYFLAV